MVHSVGNSSGMNNEGAGGEEGFDGCVDRSMSMISCAEMMSAVVFNMCLARFIKQ